MDKHFWCAMCDERKWCQRDGGTGYASRADGTRICYDCCAIDDKAWMVTGQPIVLYLSKRAKDSDGRIHWQVQNWPASLTIHPRMVKRSEMRGFGWRPIPRYDVWFKHAGHCWHGVNQGDSQILRCRVIKRLPR